MAAQGKEVVEPHVLALHPGLPYHVKLGKKQ